jgi:hypothetical protein
MIQVTVTHVQGIELATARTIAIDPEKIVDIRRRGIYTEIDYSESYDRKWKPITYQITAALPNIQAAIQGDWVGKEYLAVTVVWGEPREMRPNIWGNYYALDIQQKFIIDIEEVYYTEPVAPYRTGLVTKLRFTSSAFLQKVVYVSEDLHDLVPDVPSETTTTTTALPATTTTTEEPVTTTTEIATTTTTVVYDEIYLSNFYYVGAPPPFTQYGDTLESACEVLGMVQSVTLMYTWCYLVPDGLDSSYVYEHYTHTLMPEGYYLIFTGEGYVIIYVDGAGLTTSFLYSCETTTTTTPIQ